MGKETIDNNSTISDIVRSLRDPVEYVRSVLQNMLDYRSERGDAYIRIGITGHGIVPHYRVAHLPEMITLLPPDIYSEEEIRRANEANYRAFHGSSHKRLAWNKDQLNQSHWSGSEMNIEEVKALLGKLRTGKSK